MALSRTSHPAATVGQRIGIGDGAEDRRGGKKLVQRHQHALGSPELGQVVVHQSDPQRFRPDQPRHGRRRYRGVHEYGAGNEAESFIAASIAPRFAGASTHNRCGSALRGRRPCAGEGLSRGAGGSGERVRTDRQTVRTPTSGVAPRCLDRYSGTMTSHSITTTTTGAPGITMMSMMITKRTPAGRWGDV